MNEVSHFGSGSSSSSRSPPYSASLLPPKIASPCGIVVAIIIVVIIIIIIIIIMFLFAVGSFRDDLVAGLKEIVETAKTRKKDAEAKGEEGNALDGFLIETTGIPDPGPIC